MKKLLTSLMTALFTLIFSYQMFAQPGQRLMEKRGMRPARQGLILHFLEANQEELKLTNTQLDKIQALAMEREELQIKYRNELNLQRLEMKKLMQYRDNLDYDKLKSQMTKNSDLRSEMFIEGMKTRDKIRNVLSPEQQQALKAKAGDMIRSRRGMVREDMKKREFRMTRPMRPGIRR